MRPAIAAGRVVVSRPGRPQVFSRPGLGDSAMNASQFLKPGIAVLFCVGLAGGDYWWEHRPEPEEKDTAGVALVVVTKSTNACFSDQVRVTGFVVPRREAVIVAD